MVAPIEVPVKLDITTNLDWFLKAADEMRAHGIRRIRVDEIEIELECRGELLATASNDTEPPQAA